MTTLPNPPSRLDAALAVLRVVIGEIFIVHGAQKLSSSGTQASAFGQMGVPLAGVTGPVVSVLECSYSLDRVLAERPGTR